jgi:hypothetical protein
MREIVSFVVADGYPSLPNHLKEGEVTIKQTITREQLLGRSTASAKSKTRFTKARKLRAAIRDNDKSYVTLQIVKAPDRKPEPPNGES